MPIMQEIADIIQDISYLRDGTRFHFVQMSSASHLNCPCNHRKQSASPWRIQAFTDLIFMAYKFIKSDFLIDGMVKYRLTCKNCDMNHVHETDHIDTIGEFWKNWNNVHGEGMKCVHDYLIEVLD